MRRSKQQPALTSEQMQAFIDKYGKKDVLAPGQPTGKTKEYFLKLSKDQKDLFQYVLELAEKIHAGNQLGHVIEKEALLTLIDKIKVSYQDLLNHIKTKMGNKENIDEDLHILYVFSGPFDTLIGNLLVHNQHRENILFSKLIRKRYFELMDITEKAIAENLITDSCLKKKPYTRLVDLNGCIARSAMELGQTQESLNYIDEALDTFESHKVHSENSESARNYLYRMAAIQFLKLNDMENSRKWINKILEVDPKWSTDSRAVKCICDFVRILMKTDLADALQMLKKILEAHKEWNKDQQMVSCVTECLQPLPKEYLSDALVWVMYIIENVEWYREEKLVNYVGECIRALIQTKKTEDELIAKDLCKLLLDFKKQIPFAKQCLTLLQKRAIKIANQKSKEEDKISKTVAAAPLTLQPTCETLAPKPFKMVMPKEEKLSTSESSLLTEEDKASKTVVAAPVVLQPANENSVAQPSKVVMLSTNESPENKQQGQKQKIKTRGVATKQVENTVEEQPTVSDAVKFGFSDIFSNEMIYPLRSNTNQGIYFAIYPNSVENEHPDMKQTHTKIRDILGSGKIGAHGNCVRYIPNKPHAFKVGNSRENTRFFSRIAQEVVVEKRTRNAEGKEVVERQRRVLLSFEVKHKHNTQHKEYEVKTPTKKG